MRKYYSAVVKSRDPVLGMMVAARMGTELTDLVSSSSTA